MHSRAYHRVTYPHSLTHSLTRSLTDSLAHLLTHSLTAHIGTCSLPPLFAHSLTYYFFAARS